jgi:glycine oxidase
MAARPSDVVVVGAGIIGCAVAYELARRGVSVQLLDERPAGMGATQASAGMLAPYVEANETSPLLDFSVRSLDLFDDFVARVSADSGIPVQYRRTGTLLVASQEDRLRELQATASALSRRSVAAELIDGRSACEEEPSLAKDTLGALLIRVHGFVAAGELTRALATAAQRLGAQLIESARARRIRRKADGDLVVETARGPLTGNTVVVAAGSWSGQIEVEGVSARVPVRPVRGQLLQVAWSGPALRRVTWGERCYLVPWEDGTMLVGATVEEAGFDERATVAGVRDLMEAACDLVPRTWTTGFLGARVGLRPGTADDLPIIGPSSVVPNLIYATGHYRNGVLLAPITAQIVAEALLTDRIDPALEALSPARFGDL